MSIISLNYKKVSITFMIKHMRCGIYWCVYTYDLLKSFYILHRKQQYNAVLIRTVQLNVSLSSPYITVNHIGASERTIGIIILLTWEWQRRYTWSISITFFSKTYLVYLEGNTGVSYCTFSVRKLLLINSSSPSAAYVHKWTRSIGPGNGFSPVRRQAITWTNVE